MLLKNMKFILPVVAGAAILTAFDNSPPHRPLGSFSHLESRCYDRKTEPYTAIVDTHLHFRAFGGDSIPFTELVEYLDKTGVRFANVNGIGQVLPKDSACIYYRDCPGTPVRPSTENDFINAEAYLQHLPKNIHLTLSMTFPDLANPEPILETMHFYDETYPNMFKWMGEVNLIKAALFKNQHKAATRENIKAWAPFMAVLEERNIPITIHADLGNDQDMTKYLPLMKHVLATYPNNKIVWAHMGVSKELLMMPPAEHIETMKAVLNEYPNVTLDISWRVLNDHYYTKPGARALYVAFFNEYYDRILPGSDFVASSDKNINDYREELEVTSHIYQYLNDNAFRHIALGENYFRLLELPYYAPQICTQ